MSAEDVWRLLQDEYLPFRLYADHVHGTPVAILSSRTGLTPEWIAERIEAARGCIESGSRLRSPFQPAA